LAVGRRGRISTPVSMTTSHRVQIAPSILAGDFLHLEDAVLAAEGAQADRLHIDVMDGRFVPNISIGIPVVESIRAATRMVLETHLMIVEPEKYLADFSRAGADLIIVHQEVSPNLYRTLEQVHECQVRAGVAVNPGTPASSLQEVLELADLILVMTVSPGFGGQEFIETMLSKIAWLRNEIDRLGLETEIEVDGGITTENARRVVAAGARVLVAGTSVYRAEQGVGAAVQSLRLAGESALN
jgi:ribulose-phosphate 3-epimerase